MDKALSLFGPHTAQWFESCVGQPTRVQAEGWPAIARGETALIAAPTGTGKTLTAFLWFIDRLMGLAARGALEMCIRDRDRTVSFARIALLSPWKNAFPRRFFSCQVP